MVKPIILALDGGGTRALASIRFLQRLEEATNQNMSEVVSAYAGVSAGALICLSMASSLSSAQDLENSLFSHANLATIFDKSMWDRILPIQTQPVYDGVGKHSVIQQNIPQHLTLGDVTKPTAIVTYDLASRQPVVFTSTDTPHVSVLELADATSAAPIYFPPVKIGGRWHIDGGLIANNVGMQAVVEGHKLWGIGNFQVLSIGTGAKKDKHIDGNNAKHWGLLGWWLEGGLLDILSTSPQDMVTNQCQTLLGDDFLRVDGDMVNTIALDDTSSESRKQLLALGDQWFDEFGEAAVAMLTGKNRPLAREVLTLSRPTPRGELRNTGCVVV